MKIIANVFAILFETYFMYKMICKFKNVKSNKLYLLMVISYFVSLLFTNFDYKFHNYYYIIMAILYYISLKIIFKSKTQIIDIFIINITYIYLWIFSSIYILCIQNYNIAFIIYVLTLSIIMFLPANYNNFYKKYCKLWNRRDDGKIKAITIRNISLYIINISLFLANIILPIILKNI